MSVEADRNMPNGTSKPPVPLPRRQLVVCYLCVGKQLGHRCAVCRGAHYVNVDPEKCPDWDPVTT